MAERYIPEHRRTNYKAKGAFASDVVRRRREEQQVEIRKAKREENLAKRRGIGTGENRPGASLGAAPDSDDDTAPTESQVRYVAIFLSFHTSSSSWINAVAPFAAFQVAGITGGPGRCARLAPLFESRVLATLTKVHPSPHLSSIRTAAFGCLASILEGQQHHPRLPLCKQLLFPVTIS